MLWSGLRMHRFLRPALAGPGVIITVGALALAAMGVGPEDVNFEIQWV